MSQGTKAADLLQRFRALGGVADNVQLRQGPHGWGLFVVDPEQPVRVITPAHLLIAPQDLCLSRDRQVRVRPQAALAPEFRSELVSFHEAYQREVGWGAGGWARSLRHHQQRQALPATLQPYLALLGGQPITGAAPTPEQAFQAHCVSRQIGVAGRSCLMPVLELINHAPDGAAYVVDQGVGLTGRFTDEVFACYRRQMDAFHFLFNYHFVSPARVVLSGLVTIELPGLGVLHIARDDARVDHHQGIPQPQVTVRSDQIHLSFVTLADLDAPARPREVFVRLMLAQGLPTTRGHELFDGLIAHHRQVLQAFIQVGDAAVLSGGEPRTEGGLAHQLQQVARGQLTNLVHSPWH
ncbi:MAG TPA: hypothetical protein PLS22_07085 [Aquabacterium sp.]|nr:hypothetical protein [Aquabacterium sp.]